MIGRSMTAELFALRRRPAIAVLAMIWTLQLLIFAYLVNYIVYLTMGADMTETERTTLINGLLPENLHHYVVASMPIWGGPVMLIIGGMISAADFRWGTLRTVLARFADRNALLIGRFLGMATVMLIIALVSVLAGVVGSTAIALADGLPVSFPSAAGLLGSAGSLWLIATAWGSAGFALGVITRSIGATIGIGLVWTLAVENILGALAGAFGLNGAKAIFLGPSSASLAEALGSTLTSGGGFGISAVTGPGPAIAVLAAYTIAGLALSMAVFRRRDVI